MNIFWNDSHHFACPNPQLAQNIPKLVYFVVTPVEQN
jgi:hypothetical protein